MSSVNFHRKPNPVGSTKNRKFLLSHIDIVDIHESNGNWTIKPPQSASNTNNPVQPVTSPLSRSNPNVRSVRHLAPPTRIETSHSPSRVLSNRTLSNNNPTAENTQEKTVKTTFSKREKALRTVLPTSPNLRELRKNQELLTTGTTFEAASVTQEPRIEILDIALSPQIKRKMQGPKQDKILKLLNSYIPSATSNRKVVTQPPTAGLVSSMTSETTAQELQPLNLSHVRKGSLQETAWESLSKPVNPVVVLTDYGQYLTPYEKDEIQGYQDIYFVSDCQHKKFVQSQEEFDDERGDYVVIQGDHINYQYEVIEMLGRGSFGQVIKVFDHKNKEYVALKIIRSLKKFRTQAKVEIKLLEYMTENKGADYNIMDLKEHFKFRRHTCLVFELMSINLYDFLKLNKFQGLHLSILRKIAIQVLYALKFLHRHKIIHCDLKPENILLKQPNRTGVRLIDFGSSCFENEKLYTYIQSRFYRAPEVILGIDYTTQIDMWSFGCLLFELYSGYPVFSGETEHDQLCAMMEVLGVPDFHFLARSPRKKTFFEDDLKPKLVPNSKGRIRAPDTISVECLLDCEDKNFVDLVQHCLVYEPRKRYTPDDALSHPWILEDLPKELRTQHMKLIGKLDNASYGQVSQSQVLPKNALKDKALDLSHQEKSHLRRSSQPKLVEEGMFSEVTYLEVPGTTISTQQETIGTGSPKQGYSRMGKKDLKAIYSQGSLIPNATVNLNSRSGQNTLRNKMSSSRDNMIAGHISPHSPKDGANKISSRNDILSAKNSERAKYTDKLRKVTSSGKINERQISTGTTSSHYREDIMIRDQSTKENNLTEEEYGINRKNMSIYKSWNFSKSSFETKQQQQGGEPKKANRPTSQRNNIPAINIKSPHRRKLV